MPLRKGFWDSCMNCLLAPPECGICLLDGFIPSYMPRIRKWAVRLVGLLLASSKLSIFMSKPRCKYTALYMNAINHRNRV